MKSSGSAHGKVILFGEHSVVYGCPAIASAIALCLDVSLEYQEAKSTDDGYHITILAKSLLPGRSHLNVKHLDIRQSLPFNLSEEARFLAQSMMLALADVQAPSGHYDFAVSGELPVGKGMGSSAALSVALLRAVDEIFQRPPSEQMFERANRLEQIFHGTPSGLDAAVVSLGGVLRFTKGPPVQMDSVPCHGGIPVVVIDSGEVGCTRELVQGVSDRYGEHPAEFDALFGLMSDCAEQGALALTRGDLPELGRLMDENHRCLQNIGVSTKQLDHLVETSRAAGALGAKMSGAGGGGIVIAVCESVAQADGVAETLRRKKLTVWTSLLGL